MDGINLFSTRIISVGDILIIGDYEYELGKGKDMSTTFKTTSEGLIYQEFSLCK